MTPGEVHWQHPRHELENPVLLVWPSNGLNEQWVAEIVEHGVAQVTVKEWRVKVEANEDDDQDTRIEKRAHEVGADDEIPQYAAEMLLDYDLNYGPVEEIVNPVDSEDTEPPDGPQMQFDDYFSKQQALEEMTPTEPDGLAGEGEILWRRHDAENTDKLVEVTQRLEDYDDGHMEYVLEDPTRTYRWQYHEDDLDACFWTTGIINDETKAVMNDRVREIYQRVCDHSFSEVHDEETLEVSGEQCLHCRKKREAQ